MLRFIVIFLFLCGITGNSLFGQVRPRINRPVTRSAYVRLPGSTHPLASPANDRGRAAADLPMERMLLLLDRSPEQQDALDRLLAEQQDPASPRYHQWLSPDEFGQQFGPAQEDLDTIVSWLEGQGFQVANVARGRNVIEFNGTARQVEDAFQTQMHRYQVNGVAHIANSSAVAIPDALAPVVRGVVSLNSFRRRPLHHVLQAADGGPVPQETIASRHMMVPYDFAAIYNVGPLWDSGFDGTGQSIAIVARSNIRSSDTATFRSAFGLPANNTQVVVAGTDPGVVSGDDLEADLDAQWSGAVAKGATVKLVVATSTRISDGVDLAAQYIVNNNLAGVVSMSFGSCESDMGTSGNLFYNTLWSQAAAQGMSVFVSSGDSGSAGCDDPTSSSPATRGFAVNGLASTPYDVAVGGTGFNDTASPSTWWNSSNDSHLASAKGYIPEVVWNESAYVSSGSSANGLWAGSGGVSNVYPTPSWQTGNGVPAVDPGGSGHHRYIPDVSLNGALHDGYQVYNNGRVTTVGGTSASTPAMAGIMAIVNQYTGGRSGNPDLRLYSLASSAPFVFHDVTAGSNGVPCSGGSPNCSSGGPFSTVGSLVGYTATAGFDLATGWGSVDAHALVLNWAQVAAATHLSVAAPASAILGVPFNVTVKALDASGNTAISYTGSVRLTSTDAAAILPANANLPGGTGTFSVTLKSAGNWAVAAIDSGNSSISGTSSTITVSNALADLAISSLTAPTAVVPGAQVNAVVTVMNKGTGASGPFGVEFFFSATPVFSAAALDTGSSCAVQGLTSGASGNCTGAVKVPATLTPGTWYLVAVADFAGAVAESNESNNSRVADSGPITVNMTHPPSAVGANPGAGSGLAQTFTFTFFDPDGAQNLDVVNVLFNNSLDGRNACYLAYSRSANLLYLVSNDGSSLSSGLALNGAGSVTNNQCSVAGAGSSANAGGTSLTLTLAVTFTSSFSGNKTIYMAARDIAQNNSGWQALATWAVPGFATFPAVAGANPARGNGSSQTFTFTFMDSKGFQDLGVENILINSALDGQQACYLAYSRPLNFLYLVNDAGSALLPGLALNGTGSVGNSQCTVSGAGSSAGGSGNTLTLTLNISFTAAFRGNRVIYLAARDNADSNNSGWQPLGSWTIQ